MTPELVVEIGQRAIMTVLLVASPLLGFGLLVGLLVSIFQAVTQIQEMTLTFVPKIVVVLVSLVVFGNWMLNLLIQFTTDIIQMIPAYIR